MDPHDTRTIEGMVRAFEEVSRIIKAEQPDGLIAPMLGAVPFIDILNIIDDEFPNDKVEYVPASNKIYRLREVLRGAFGSLIEAYAPTGGYFLSLDEVVSGNSLVRVYKQFDAARNDHATKKTKEVYGPQTDFRREEVQAYRQGLVEKIKYKSIGIVDPKLERQGKLQNREYLSLVQQGVVIPVMTQGIVTMDRTGFFPAQYSQGQDGEGNQIYLPRVERFEVQGEYLTFLRTVAGIVGKDPDKVTVQNMGKIIHSHHHVPEGLRGI